MKASVCILGMLMCMALTPKVFSQIVKDLKITEVKIKPVMPKIGDKVIISYQVQNAGNQLVTKQAYSVSLKINGELVSFDDDTDAVAIGQSVSYSKAEGSYHKLIEKKGAYNWEIKIKSNFRDANPKDNVSKGTIVVQ